MSVMEWQKQVLRESGYRRCILLHGNVRDLWPAENGRFIRLSEHLCESLPGYTIKGTWDSVDGLSFQDDGQRKAFDDSLQLAEYGADSQEGDDYQLGDVTINEVDYSDPDNAFPAIRKVLTASGNQRPLFIIDWSEHLLAKEQDAQ